MLWYTYMGPFSDANSVMIARGAQYNPSAFRKEGLVSNREAAEAYIKWVSDINHNESVIRANK